MSRVKRPVAGALPVVVCVAAAIFATFRIGGWGDPQTIRAVNDLTLLGFGCFALGCAIAASRRSQGRQRRAWAYLAVGIGGWVTAVAVWTYYTVVLGLPQVPHLALGVLAFALPIAGCLALITFPVGYAGQSQWRFLLDGLIVEGSLFLIAWVVVLERMYHSSAAPRSALTLTLMATVADMVTITVAVLVVSRARTGQRLVLVLLAAGLAVMAVSDILFVHVTFNHASEGARFVAAGWAVGILTLGLGAFVGCRPTQTPPSRASLPASMSMWLPYVPLILAGIIVAGMHREHVQSGPVLGIGMALVIVVLARQFVVVTDNRRLLGIVADRAMRDPLTGLANRDLFDSELAQAVSRYHAHKRPLAVLSLDVDDFKVVNDSMGHSAGDALLKSMAERLKGCVRDGDTVARLGGDEFVVLIQDPADDAHAVARRVVDAFAVPFDIDGQDLLLQPSVGLAVTSHDDRTIAGDVLVKRADVAMYSAKRLRTGGLQTFGTGMDLADFDEPHRNHGSNPRLLHDGAEAVRLLGELRRAIGHSDLVTVYQPKFDLVTLEVVGVEALVRWPNPDRGILGPEEFLPLVRQHGLMHAVTEHVIEMALDDALNWYRDGGRIPVAVNLFAASLGDARLPDRILNALAARDLQPEALIVEITEDLLVDDMMRARTVLLTLREAGVRISLDDFGSGYSALRNLRELPIDEVKLDHDFTASILTDTRSAAIVRAVIDLAHDLGVAAVAEGVENSQTADRLREYGCDMAQGFHFCRPVSSSEILELLVPTAGPR